MSMLFKRIKDWSRSITAFRTGDVIPVDGPDGTAKMSKDNLLKSTAQNALAGNVATEFVPNETNAVAGMPYVYDGNLYVAKENYSGTWDISKFTRINLSLQIEIIKSEDNPEYAWYIKDDDDKLLAGITKEGEFKVFLHADFKNGIDGTFADSILSQLTDVEFVYRINDNNGNFILGVDKTGQIKFACGVPTDIRDFVIDAIGNYYITNIECGGYGPTSWTILGKLCNGAKNNYCTAVGYRVMNANTGIKNVSVGSDNMENASGHDNTSMGYHAQFRLGSGDYNSSFGSESQDDVTSGKENTSSGFCSLQRNNTGDHNVAVGAYALQGIYENRFDPENLKKHFDNVAVGFKALWNAEHLSEKNVALGMNTLGTTRKYVNCIAIGYGADCDADNKAVIGNEDITETKVFGDLVVKGTDNINRKIVFNNDGTCSWVALT